MQITINSELEFHLFPHVAWNFATFGGNFREVLILLIRGSTYSNLASSVGLKLQKSCHLYVNWWNPIWSYRWEIDNNNIGVTHAFINLFIFCNAKYRQRVSLICLLVTLEPLRLLPILKLKRTSSNNSCHFHTAEETFLNCWKR